MALAGAVVSKPTPKNTTCRSGFSDGQFDGIERRIDDAHVAALALDLEQIAAVPGTRSMSPNEQKITPGCAAMASALSISSSGVTHTGQPGPWTISSRGQHLVDAVLDDGVRLAAADFHDLPRARGGLVDFPRDPLRDLAVAKLGQVLHGPSRLLGDSPQLGNLPGCELPG